MPVGNDTAAYRRDLPHLQKPGKTYFVTFCSFRRRVIPGPARTIALESCVHGHRIDYWLEAAIVMPDHVHLIVMPYERDLQTVLKAIKSASSHAITRLRILQPPVWQDESLDHILRSGESMRSMAEYICLNPVRKGLVSTPDDWPWLWRSWIEGAAGEGARRHT